MNIKVYSAAISLLLPFAEPVAAKADVRNLAKGNATESLSQDVAGFSELELDELEGIPLIPTIPLKLKPYINETTMELKDPTDQNGAGGSNRNLGQQAKGILLVDFYGIHTDVEANDPGNFEEWRMQFRLGTDGGDNRELYLSDFARKNMNVKDRARRYYSLDVTLWDYIYGAHYDDSYWVHFYGDEDDGYIDDELPSCISITGLFRVYRRALRGRDKDTPASDEVSVVKGDLEGPADHSLGRMALSCSGGTRPRTVARYRYSSYSVYYETMECCNRDEKRKVKIHYRVYEYDLLPEGKCECGTRSGYVCTKNQQVEHKQCGCGKKCQRSGPFPITADPCVPDPIPEGMCRCNQNSIYQAECTVNGRSVPVMCVHQTWNCGRTCRMFTYSRSLPQPSNRMQGLCRRPGGSGGGGGPIFNPLHSTGSFLFPGDDLPIGNGITYRGYEFGIAPKNKNRITFYEHMDMSVHERIIWDQEEAVGTILSLDADGVLRLRNEHNDTVWLAGDCSNTNNKPISQGRALAPTDAFVMVDKKGVVMLVHDERIVWSVSLDGEEVNACD